MSLSQQLNADFQLVQTHTQISMRDLREALHWQSLSTRLYGREIPLPRLVAMYGEEYAYSNGVRHPRATLPEILLPLQNLTGRPFNSVLAKPLSRWLRLRLMAQR